MKIAEVSLSGGATARDRESSRKPQPDVYLATALAVWLGRRVQTHGRGHPRSRRTSRPRSRELRRIRCNREAWAATTKRKTKEWWQA